MSTEEKNLQDQSEEQQDMQALFIGIGIGIVVITLIVVVGGVLLAANADTASTTVEVIRDFTIIVMALELIVIAIAVIVFLVQGARFINLLNNEIQPIITSAQDTVNTVRGTAAFLSKNLTEPVMKANSTFQAINKTLKDVDAIRKVTEIAFSAATTPTPEIKPDEPVQQREDTNVGAEDSPADGGSKNKSIDDIGSEHSESKGD